MKAAYPGLPGAFAHRACEVLLPGSLQMPCDSIEEAAMRVAQSEADAGILPLKNSIAGEVPGVARLIEEHSFRIMREASVAVQLHLITMPECNIEDIRRVVSHPMALRQCRTALALLGVELVSAESTAHAARGVCDPTTAVLASEHAAAAYDLKIVRRNMMDEDESFTTFCVVTGRPDILLPSSTEIAGPLVHFR